MPRQARKASKTGYYHVIQRGAGKQVLFEDRKDYERYIDKLSECKKELDFKLCAYCLMNNHVHMLIHVDEITTLSRLMRRLGSSYAGYYNVKYEHVGYVFQDRYLSEPIDDETYLLACVRYIHNNPVKAGFGERDEYRWSSYNEYRWSGYNVAPAGITIVDSEGILGMFDSVEQFVKFSQSADDKNFIDVEVGATTCEVGQQIIRKHFGNEFENTLMVKQLRVAERNQIIREMKAAGMNNHQIELVTGVSRKIVSHI